MTAIPRRHLLALSAAIPVACLQGCGWVGISLTSAAGCSETRTSFKLAYAPARSAPNVVDRLATALKVRGFTIKGNASIRLCGTG